MSLPAQEFSVAYAGVTVGGSSTDYTLDGAFQWKEDYPTGEFSCDVVVGKQSQYTEAQFAAACAALEVAWRTPRGALLVKIGTTTLISRNPAAGTNTGLNTEPSYTKSGEMVDTGRTRKYRLTVRYGMPADLSGQNGRQSSLTAVDYDAARIRTVTFTGVYTALGGSQSRAVYTANSPTFFNAALAALGGTYEIISEDPRTDDADKYCTFTTVYREIVYAQALSGTNHANIVSHTVTFNRSAPAPGDSGGGLAKRMETITCTYVCRVRDTNDLENLYAGTIRPYLVQQLKAKFPSSYVALVLENPIYEHAGQSISATLTFQTIRDAGDGLLESEASMGYRSDPGKRFVGAWTGTPTDFYLHQGFQERYLVQTHHAVYQGLIPPVDRTNGNVGLTGDTPYVLPGEWNPEGGGGWELVAPLESRSIPRKVGMKGGDQFDTTEIFETATKRFRTVPPKGKTKPTTPGDSPVTGTTTPSAGGPTTPSGAGEGGSGTGSTSVGGSGAGGGSGLFSTGSSGHQTIGSGGSSTVK